MSPAALPGPKKRAWIVPLWSELCFELWSELWVALGSRLPSPEGEVGEWYGPEGVDDYHDCGPQPFRAADLACWPPRDVDERRDLEAAFGNGCGKDESAVALATMAPVSSSGHDILRVHGRDPRSRSPYSSPRRRRGEGGVAPL